MEVSEEDSMQTSKEKTICKLFKKTICLKILAKNTDSDLQNAMHSSSQGALKRF